MLSLITSFDPGTSTPNVTLLPAHVIPTSHVGSVAVVAQQM